MTEVLLSQLSHVELISPRPEETVDFLTRVVGLEETTRTGQSVYLRAWMEWLHSSIIVTEGEQPGVRRTGWRTYGPQDPETIARLLDGTEEAIGWVDDWEGHGRTFQFRSPHGGQLHEVFWEVEKHVASPETAETQLAQRPQRFPNRGIGARYFDHVNFPTGNMVGDIDFYKRLGFRHTASTEVEPGFSVFSVLTSTAIRGTHDLALVPDFSGVPGRAHHIAFRVDQRVDVERAAEAFIANGIEIEWGPTVHGIDEITTMYAREPGGFRIEVNAGGIVNQLPDWEPAMFPIEKGAGANLYQNGAPPHKFTESFPPLPEELLAQQDAGYAATGLEGNKPGIS